MRRLNQVAAAAFMLVGVLMMVLAREYQFSNAALGIGSGFMPMITGGAIILLSAVVFVNSAKVEPKEIREGFIPDRAGLFRLAALIGSLIVVTLVLNTLGFRLTLLFFLIFNMIVLGERRLPLIATIALFGSWGAYWLFVDQLMVPLPSGVFGF